MVVMNESYQGYLVAANPSNPRDMLSNSVILICQNTDRVTYGLQINNPLPDLHLDSIMAGLDLYHESKEPIYHGGNLKNDKIQVIHSTDWLGMTSQKITDDIAVTGDISILTAIAAGEGPEKFKACAGFWAWESGTLHRQINGKNQDLLHRWEAVSATQELVFETVSYDCWNKTLEASAKQQINAWF
jgi:putative transcriptional regulator